MIISLNNKFEDWENLQANKAKPKLSGCWGDYSGNTAEMITTKEIAVPSKNLDPLTVTGFGKEWSKFDQNKIYETELGKIFDDYFSIFPWDQLPPSPIGADIGCGSGRWARCVAPRVGFLHLVDASYQALNVAKENLKNSANVKFHHKSVDNLPFDDCSLDFAYSLGVLHHVPDTIRAIQDIAKKLKPGAPFLLYLYYRFDNRGNFFRALWKISDYGRRLICRLPFSLRYTASQILALIVYLPFARFAKVLSACRILPAGWPLSYYRDKPWYVLRTDALDRFGTSLEKRFSRDEIETMLKAAGLENIQFSKTEPFWCGVGFKRV